MFSLIVFSILNIGFCIGVDVTTTSGTVRGQTIHVLNKSVDQFLGIPYAVPPLGSLRFAKPVPIRTPLTGIIDATKPKSSCIQILGGDPRDGVIEPQSEDCLFLNIWTTDVGSTASKPVMIFFYGGALLQGSIFQNGFLNFNGSVLSTRDIVLVTVNYRVGGFGFMFGGSDSDAPGSAGFLDQITGIKWVRSNIHLFGGDPNQITIFGQSAGSWSVSAHLFSPLSKGLFNRAILESGAALYNKAIPPITTAQALVQAQQFAQSVNCRQPSSAQWLRCLRDLSADVILNNFKPNGGFVELPIIGTEFLPISAQQAFADNQFNSGIDIIAGVAQDEGRQLANFYFPGTPVLDTLTLDTFIGIVNEGHQTFKNFDVNRAIDFYLSGVDTNNVTALQFALYNFIGDIAIKCSTYKFAIHYKAKSPHSKVFFYEVTAEANVTFEQELGVSHTAELPFVFGSPFINPSIASPFNRALSNQVLGFWTDFAKTGTPAPAWPQFVNRTATDSVPVLKNLNINSPNLFVNPFAATCDGFWENYF